MSNKDEKLDVGDESVVMGNVSGRVGDRSVVIGPTDNKGNVILNKAMAVGHNAHAGPDSIAIGANAGAGSEIGVVLAELRKVVMDTGDQSLVEAFTDLCSELNRPKKDKPRISQLWDTIRKAAALSEAIGLLKKLGSYIASLPF